MAENEIRIKDGLCVVFLIILANSNTMIEKSFIIESSGSFLEGDIHLRFNISRVFERKDNLDTH